MNTFKSSIYYYDEWCDNNTSVLYVKMSNVLDIISYEFE